MSNIDLIAILGNVSQSLLPVQKLISGCAYLLGILFFITAIMKLRKIADTRAQSSSHEKMFGPMMYLLFGSALLYLPSALEVMANTFFGESNVLTYTPRNPANVYKIITVFVRTAGVIWFVRGCVLVAQASEPGEQHGAKGLAFLFAGVFAINFENSTWAVNYLLNSLFSWSASFKALQGY